MQFLGDGPSGPNGRSVKSSDQQDGTPPSDTPEESGGVRGSLMQRYRGAGTQPDGTEKPADPPLPPPRTAADDKATPPAVQSGSWSASGTTAGTSTPPADPGTGSGTGWGTRTGTTPAVPPSPVAPAHAKPAEPAAAAAPATVPATAPAKPAVPAAAATPATPAAPAAPARPAATPVADAGPTPAPQATDGKRTTLAPEQTTDFKRRWRELQGDFVDDPQQAVRAADDLTREVLGALTAKIADKKRVEGWKAGDGTAGTEDLRQSLRQYRTLVDRLLEL